LPVRTRPAPDVIVIDITPVMRKLSNLQGAVDYFSCVSSYEYVKTILSTPMTCDIYEVIRDFDEKHLGEIAGTTDFDLELLSFFHEMAIQVIDETIFDAVNRDIDLEDFEFREIYRHTNALVLTRRK